MAKNPVTYNAPHRVYVDQRMYEPGEPFTTAEKPGKDWERLTPAEKAAADAASELHQDPPLESLSKAALEAVAVTKGVNPKGLGKDDLITAIRAADDPTR